MSALPIEIVRANFERELPRARELAKTHGWGWEDDIANLTARAGFTALDGERFVLYGEFDDYKAKPPYLDFEDPQSDERGTTRAYPKGHDSFFHSTGPIICAPFSRKAYRQVHQNWQYGDWISSRENNVNWSQYSTISGMYLLVYTRITHPNYYRGRMG